MLPPRRRLGGQADEILLPFRQAGIDVADYFYFGESVLQRGYRGQGVGVRFFELREAQALRAVAEFATFCGVVRAFDDPRWPPGHVLLDAFWQRRGYAPVVGRECQMSWKEVGEREETPKRMQFWQKRLSP